MQRRAEIMDRASKVLHCADMGQIELDPLLVEQMTSEVGHDIFLLQIADIFRQTVISFDVDPSTADIARRAFYAMKNYQIEESKVDSKLITVRQFDAERLIQSLEGSDSLANLRPGMRITGK